MVKRKNLFCIVLAFIMLLFTLIPTYQAVKVAANTTQYTSVLDDLKRDVNFTVENYPANAMDYSLQVITVAEGVDLRLYVYVYQPSYVTKPLQATSINISRGSYGQLSFKNYSLSLISLDGMFQKYVVEGLTVSSADSRVYEISSIFRLWDSKIDDPAKKETNNVISEVSYPVARRWVFNQTGTRLDLSVEDIDVITVTDKYCGFLRYPSNSANIGLNYEMFDVHFVAFSTDKRIDKLLEADVYYVSQFCHSDLTFGVNNEFGPKEDKYAYLNYKVDMEFSGSGWWSNTYKWKSIEPAKDFIKSQEIQYSFNAGILDVVTNVKATEESLAILEKQQWVLRFAATEYDYYENGKGDNRWEEFTRVGNVSILRLYFETDGNFYNLGVVDNKQTGSSRPSNTVEQSVEWNFEKLWEMILKLVGIIVIVFLIWNFMPNIVVELVKFVLRTIWKGIKAVFRFIWLIITAPFRWIFRRR